jgi:hypothetical protein
MILARYALPREKRGIDSHDLQRLLEVLSSVKDSTGKCAVFTALSISANPDFDRMKSSGYGQYHYELLADTWRNLPGYEGVAELWSQAISNRLIVPQFHGREHLNVNVLMANLANSDPHTLMAFEEDSYCGISSRPYPTVDYVAAFQFAEFSENRQLETIVTDGLNCFEKVFGFRARHFAAPGAREHRSLSKVLKDGGVQFLDTDMIVHEHQGNGKYTRRLNFTGNKTQWGQTYLVRNCVYEPTPGDNFDWVEYCIEQISNAFFFNKPAIISTHRVNFVGRIDPSHGAKGLADLSRLLKRIMVRWPNVEFLTTTELGDLVSSNK